MNSRSAAHEFVRGDFLDAQRRSAMRFPLDVPVVFWWQDPRGEHRQAEGRVYDVSEFGAFFLASVCPPAGTLVGAKISIPAFETPRALRMQVEGQVLRVEQIESGNRRDGFAILSDTSILSEEDKSAEGENSASRNKPEEK